MAGPKGAAAAAAVQDVSGDDIGEDIWDQGGGSLLENDDNPDNEVVDDEDDATAQAAESDDDPEADDGTDEQAEEGEAEEIAEEVAQDEDEALDENGQPYQPINPPNNWPQQEQVFFRKLPPVMQHAFINRARAMTADYTTKTQQLAQVRNYYRDVDQVLAPRIKGWQLAGMNTGQALNQLLALSDMASEKPLEFIQYFAQLRGIDLGSVGQNPQGGAAPNGNVDPQVAALQRQLAQVQSTVSQTVQQQRQREQQARQAQQIAQQRNAEAVINQFASQVGPDGKPLYPYFNQLEGAIATFLNSGQAKSIPQAYEMAAWANPQVRQRLQARLKNEENAKARKAAEKAKRAAVSVSGASGVGSGRVRTDDMSIASLMRGVARGDIT